MRAAIVAATVLLLTACQHDGDGQTTPYSDAQMEGRESVLKDIYETCRTHRATVHLDPPAHVGWHPNDARYIFGCAYGEQAQ